MEPETLRIRKKEEQEKDNNKREVSNQVNGSRVLNGRKESNYTMSEKAKLFNLWILYMYYIEKIWEKKIHNLHTYAFGVHVCLCVTICTLKNSEASTNFPHVSSDNLDNYFIPSDRSVTSTPLSQLLISTLIS